MALPIHIRRPFALAAAGIVSSLVLVACSGGGAGDDAGEKLTLDMASFVSPETGQGKAYVRWMDEVAKASNGSIEIKTFWNGELLGATEIKDGLQDGRTQLGNLSYAYSPSDFPLTKMVEVPFLGDSIGAQVAAMNKLYAENEDFRNEWESQGIKVLSFVPVAPAVTGAKERVTTVDWYKGKTVRASGAFAAAVQAAGGTPAPIEVGETYEAMERGTIDAYGGLILDFLPATGLYEVGPFVHDPGLGHYAVTTWGMSMDAWEALSDEHRAIIEDANASFPEWVVQTTTEAEDAACIVVLEAGGVVEVFPEAETAKWAGLLGDGALDAWYELATSAGVADPAAMYEQMVGYYREAEAAGGDVQTGIERCQAQG